jgi:hypothetical protein
MRLAPLANALLYLEESISYQSLATFFCDK